MISVALIKFSQILAVLFINLSIKPFGIEVGFDTPHSSSTYVTFSTEDQLESF